MTGPDATTQAAAGPATEASPGKGIQPGGIPPDVQAVLNRLPEGDRSVAEEGFRNQARYVAAERQRWQQDIQVAGILRGWLKDPQFSRFVDAREKGNLPMFFRDELGTPAGEVQMTTDDPIPAAFGGNAEMLQQPSGQPPSQVDPALSRRLDSVESRLSTYQEAESTRALESFAADYPDYEAFMPGMQAARNNNPAASLEDLYFIAKGRAGGGAEPPQPGGGTEQPAPGLTSPPPPANVQQPPPPVGVTSGVSQAEEEHATTIAGAWELAKKQAGITGPVNVEFSP